MAFIDQLSISVPRNPKWVGEIREILNHQLEIHIETPQVSIFQVPETITTYKSVAYEPQHVGLGPNHHFRDLPYKKMEQKKIYAVQKFLEDHKITEFEPTVLDKVLKLVPLVRACYDMFLQDDNVSLAWVFAIDGLFLLNLFRTYEIDHSSPPSRRKQIDIDPRKRLLAQDILMVENQIPFMVLKEINEALHPSSGNNLSPSTFRTFCKIHSPFELCSEVPTSVEHLLHYMYGSIINLVPAARVLPKRDPNNAGNRFLGLTAVTNVTSLLKGVPEKEMVQVFEQTITILQNFSKQTIAIPSASKLQCRSGFKFQALVDGEGIQKIHIVENTFYLPCVTLNNNSEVILRNLMAYEMLRPDSDEYPLTEYVGMMCGLILNVDDVKLLKKENIIKGELSENEVAKLFVGMSSSIVRMKTKKKSDLQAMIVKVNKVYESGLRMKAYLLLKKLANWLVVVIKAFGSFVGASWKIVAFMVSIVTVFMLTYQAYCDVYGCEKKTVTMLSYAA